MNRVLISQIWHPFELFKSYQVRKLGFGKICHLNGTDILHLTLGVETLISCSLLVSAKIIIKGGQRRGLLWLLRWCVWWCERWLQGSGWFAQFQIPRPHPFWCRRFSKRHWHSKENAAPKIYVRYASEGSLRTFIEHLACEKNWGIFWQNGLYPNTFRD